MNSAIILGSSRSDGNTAELAYQLADKIEGEVIDLNRYTILPYDYEYENKDDDFLELIDYLLTFDNLVFASPIYWYAPSAIMKTFLDRLCDLLEIYKPRGRQLKLKSALLLSTGAAEQVDTCFEQIFSKTFEHFDMEYRGILYCRCNDDLNENAHKSLMSKFVEQHFS